jgi:hypothetical protein
MSKLIKITSPKNLIESKSKEKLEVIQSGDKKIQDTLETLNSLEI